MNDIALRLVALRGNKSRRALADELGITEGTLRNYEAGKTLPDYALLELVCKNLRIAPNWLLLGLGSPEIQDENDLGNELVMISMVDAKLSAGTGSFETSGDLEHQYAFRYDFLRHKGNVSQMVLMRVAGDSMEPTIYDKDVVLIDQSQTSTIPGKIYAVGVEDMVYIKRVNAVPGKVILGSDNPTYEPIVIATTEQLVSNVRIIGRAVWSCREW
jgi:phage repressor protein C with HTH and peptisase S24 domain